MKNFCKATDSARSSENSIFSDPEASLPPWTIFCLNWIIVTIRKICSHNSLFTQLLSFVFLPSAALQSNHHQNLIEQCMIYRKMLGFIFCFIFYFLNLINSITKLFLALSGDVTFLTDIIAVLVYQNCHFTEQQDVTSELCVSP